MLHFPHALVVIPVAMCSAVSAGDIVSTYDVGTGAMTAEIQFDFFNGNTHLYSLHWDGALSGRDVFDVLLSAQPAYFNFEYETYSFGDFLTGLSIGGDTDSGAGTPPDYIDYWHYWTSDGGGAYEESMIGFNNRMLSDGAADAWVFGHNGAPATIPAPPAFILLLATMHRRNNRAKSS